ncbi:uncharacterized protein B0T15DRAFT_510745 [Chaetomium strumarium]|uniref:WSC domain-containing protein n=1 Tax=Chaetomium strumarium TaxID=1170767 RepID=A0AAJ0M3D7_9PEZI|nr:hypothetical protein B0T15DRAFT_510745 [Chaetomium strumarium]
MPLQSTALLWASLSIAAAFKAGPTPMRRADDRLSGPSIPVEYCATVNTADMDPFNSIYQSEGRCYTNCTDLNFALAIVQEKNCWCSNLIPNSDDRTSLSDCRSPCPGYPTDYCGGDGVFGYTSRRGQSQGYGASGRLCHCLASQLLTITLSQTPSSASSSSTSDSSSSSTSSESSSTAASTTQSQSQSPVVQTVTIGGTVRTVTATAGITQPDADKDKSINGGAIAGIIIGILGGLCVAAGAIFFWLRRRREKQLNEKGMGSPVGRGGSPAMMTTTTTGEGSAAGGSAGLDSNKRRSYLMPIDPRLDPFATGIYTGDHNRSRESFNSLQDNHDYSRRVHDPPRVLRAINPDPADDD